MTEIYFLRHSEILKANNIENNDSLQLKNEKMILSINGEKLAYEKSQEEEMQNFDAVFSSNYVRTVSTAKYFTKDKINIIDSFGERKFRIDSWDELPEGFGLKQYHDYDYKMPNGESLNMLIAREKQALNKILDDYKGKKILIVGHSTAFASLLTLWCDVDFTGDYKFKNKVFFDGKWNYCQTFKLIFDNNKELMSIENIE